jgi:glycosyltransferase involved in cell wall biosynthesis
MNIALLHYSAPPVVGGVESVLAQHARLMADAGHQVRIIAGRGAQTDQRVPFYSIPQVDSRYPQVLTLKAELDAGRFPADFPELIQEIQDPLKKALEGVELLIAHNVCSLHKNLALTSALKGLVEDPDAPRLILWHHDLAWTTPRYRAELHAGYPWDLLRLAWPKAVQVVVSELRRGELAELLRIPIDQITVVPNGVDPARFFKLEAQTSQLTEQLKLLANDPLLLLPVRITPRKNIELALRTLAVLRGQFPQAGLVITGPLGPHNPANIEYLHLLTSLRTELSLEGAAWFLAELVQNYLSDEVIADFYRLADALFLPSREEGFGIPLLEAGLSGLPVFCTDIPPLQDLGQDSVTYFSPEEAPEKVARLIIEWLSKDQTYRLRRRVKKEYTWEQVYQAKIAILIGE